MTPLREIQRLAANAPKKKIERLKPRRLRRQEERDRVKSAKLTKKKNG